MTGMFGQSDFAVRLDWGSVGARIVGAEISVIVDVLSFSTSVTVAVERGMRVFPYQWGGQAAGAVAAERDAVLAAGRSVSAGQGKGPRPSLSPAALMTCDFSPRLVLPSPNGSSIAAALVDGDSDVAVGCLRNARAVADWLVPAVEAGRSVAVIAAGERWQEDNSLRVALEDHLGAGAILSALRSHGCADGFSPEAQLAADAFDAGVDLLPERLRDCVSGKELSSRGFAADVEAAADLDASTVVPVLADGAFVSAEDVAEGEKVGCGAWASREVLVRRPEPTRSVSPPIPTIRPKCSRFSATWAWSIDPRRPHS